MIITDNYVILNNPKTGSTFVRSVIKRLFGELRTLYVRRLWHQASLALVRLPVELMLPNTKALDPRPLDQHGTFEQIPRRFRGRQAVSVVRNPFDRLLSTFRYRWWQKYPGVPAAVLRDRLPSFPDLTLEEFLVLEDLRVRRSVPRLAPNVEVGVQTVQFIQMFFRDSASVFPRLDDSFLASNEYRRWMPEIHFLRTEHLNDDLVDFLAAHQHSAESLKFVRELPPENVTTRYADSPWTADIVERVCHRERLLLRILADLGLMYSVPVS